MLAAGDSNRVWARVHNGLELYVNLDDYNGRAAFFAGDVDRKLTWLCRRIVRRGDTVVDIGANIGIVTVLLADLVGPPGAVWSIEPNPTLVRHLRMSLARNGMSNVTVLEMAAGTSCTSMSLRVPLGHSGRGSLVREAQWIGYEEVSVSLAPLDAIISEKVSNIRLLKIDVEGYESEVLCGSQGLFSRTPPDAVLFELNDLSGPASRHPSVVFLRERGYVFFAIPKALLRMRVLPFDPDRDRMIGHDLLACRSGRVADEIGGLLGVRSRVPGGKQVNLA